MCIPHTFPFCTGKCGFFTAFVEGIKKKSSAVALAEIIYWFLCELIHALILDIPLDEFIVVSHRKWNFLFK